MRPERTSRALRSLVAEIAHLADADVRAVTAQLSSPERMKLLELIEEYRRDEPSPSMPANRGPQYSPWLEDRLTGRAQTRLTLDVQDKLKHLAAAQGWIDQAAPLPAPASWRTLWNRRGGRA